MTSTLFARKPEPLTKCSRSPYQGAGPLQSGGIFDGTNLLLVAAQLLNSVRPFSAEGGASADPISDGHRLFTYLRRAGKIEKLRSGRPSNECALIKVPISLRGNPPCRRRKARREKRRRGNGRCRSLSCASTGDCVRRPLTLLSGLGDVFGSPTFCPGGRVGGQPFPVRSSRSPKVAPVLIHLEKRSSPGMSLGHRDIQIQVVFAG